MILLPPRNPCLDTASIPFYNPLMSLLPNNPMMLLSVVNTQLRDEFSSLDELCAFFNAEKDDIEEKLAAIDYTYDPDLNRFV